MSLLPSLSEARQILGDPAYNFRWTVILPSDIASSLKTSFTSPTSFQSSGKLLQNPSVPYGRVENVTVPGLTVETDGRFGAASKIYYPRFLDHGVCQMSVYEDMRYQSLYYFKSWQNLIVDKNHNYYPPSVYKRTVFFMAFDPVSSDAPTLIVELAGCQPTNPGADLQYELTSSGFVSIPVTLQVDDVFYHFTGIESNNKNTKSSILSTPQNTAIG